MTDSSYVSENNIVTFYGGGGDDEPAGREHDFYSSGSKTTYGDKQGTRATDIRKEDWLVVTLHGDGTIGNNIPAVVDGNPVNGNPAGKTFPDFFSPGGTKSVYTDKDGNRATGLRPGEWDL